MVHTNYVCIQLDVNSGVNIDGLYVDWGQATDEILLI